MKQFKISIPFLLILVLSTVHSIARSQDKLPPSQFISVHFSPKGWCTEAIVHELNNAKSSILMQSYSFTSAPIAKALLNAHQKGIKVEVILDKTQLTGKYSSVTLFYNSGIPTRIDSAHAIAHNKAMIIDGEVVIAGSFNFAKAAEEKSAEDLGQQAELERLKLQAQIAELQFQRKESEAKATMRLYILLSVLTSVGLAIYWKNRERINQVLAEIKNKSKKLFVKKRIPAKIWE